LDKSRTFVVAVQPSLVLVGDWWPLFVYSSLSRHRFNLGSNVRRAVERRREWYR
jgi:hypothetical protein